MSKVPRHPDISRGAQYLKELDQASTIAQGMLGESYDDPEKNIEASIYDGYEKLINSFNLISASDPCSELIPNVAILKGLLGDEPLPQIDDLKALDYFRGMRVARGLMLEGQVNKKRRGNSELVTKAEIDHAIGAPSVDTDPRALAVGTAGHILERTIMAHLKTNGIDTSTWVKDQVLWALEDLALLQHAYSETYGGDDSELFTYFTTTPAVKDGGMGWRKKEQVDKIVEAYQEIESANKTHLLESYEVATGETYDGDIADIPYDEALGNICGEFASLEDGGEELEDAFMAALLAN